MSATQFKDWVGSFTVNVNDLDGLVDRAEHEELRRARICLHRNHNAAIQEMIIAVAPSCYIQPHRQSGIEKSYVVLRGAVRVGFFRDDGGIEEVIDLVPLLQRGNVATRFDAGRWHTVMPLGDEAAIYIETIRGPFTSDRTDWAEWAPSDFDKMKIAGFLDRLQAVPGHLPRRK